MSNPVAQPSPSSAPPAVPPQGVVMQMLMGAWVAKLASDLTRLGVPDLVARHGPVTAQDLVARHGLRVDAAALHRALRAAASLGLFSEDAQGRFGRTALTDPLTADSPVSVKPMVESFGGSWWRIWSGFGDAVRTGQPQARAQLGLEWWDYLRANPAELAEFSAAMKVNSLASQAGVLANLDLTGVRRVADVGGGYGHLAAALLARWPALRAVVVDMPEVVAQGPAQLDAAERAVADRLEWSGGDMFAAVPPAEVYVIKHIIHDWDDARCVRLLANCRAGLQGDGRVVCVDAVLPPLGDASGTAAKLLDLNMLVFIPGKERTLAQWHELFGAAGLRIAAVRPLQDTFGTSVIEGRRA
jgi:hypothetical protein